jgi:hypothetical protein
MNEEERMDSLIEDYVNHLRVRRGDCPSEETLCAFHEGTLTADLASSAQKHTGMCSQCQIRIELIKKFERHSHAEIGEISGWPEIEMRGQQRFYSFLGSRVKKEQEQKTKTGLIDRLKAVLVHPAFAYLVTLVLLYPAYLGLFRNPETVKETVREKELVEVEKPEPAISIATLHTIKLQLAERGAGSGRSAVRLSEDEPFFALAFFVPISERPEFIYDLEVRDEQGRVVAAEEAARPQDYLGNFLLVCSRELFPPGKYELRVKEINKRAQSTRREFRFSFVVENVSQPSSGK